MSPRASLALLVALSAAGCASSPQRAVARPEPAPAAVPAPEPRPQVVLTTGQPNANPAAPREQVMVSHMTEEERTEALRSAGSPIHPYEPGPLTPEIVRYEQTGGAPAYDWRKDWTNWASMGAAFAFFSMPFVLGWGNCHDW